MSTTISEETHAGMHRMDTRQSLPRCPCPYPYWGGGVAYPTPAPAPAPAPVLIGAGQGHMYTVCLKDGVCEFACSTLQHLPHVQCMGYICISCMLAVCVCMLCHIVCVVPKANGVCMYGSVHAIVCMGFWDIYYLHDSIFSICMIFIVECLSWTCPK